MKSPAISSIGIHLYELTPKSRMGSKATAQLRKGALLRVCFFDQKIGYADCFPWPELGDLPLQEQLEYFRRGKLTELTRRSVEFARLDAEARSENRSLFQGAEIPPSHFLVTDFQLLNSRLLETVSRDGFQTLKLKVGIGPHEDEKRLDEQADCLKGLYSILKEYRIKLRLDLNSSISMGQFERFIERIGPAIEWIDFVEDPIQYDPKLWTQIQKCYGVRLALDRLSSIQLEALAPKSFSVLVVKPAIQDWQKMILLAKNMNVSTVVTTYLDHPFGQLCAAWVASQIKKEQQVEIESCGLLSHFAYEENLFSKLLASQGPCLIPPDGFGFGMGACLETISFVRL